jgi:hypothetical protein
VQLSPVERYTPPGGLSSGLKGSILFLQKVYFFLGGGDEKEAAKQRWAGGAQRPVSRVNEPKKTGGGSAPGTKT